MSIRFETKGSRSKASPFEIDALRKMLSYNPETGDLTWKERSDDLFISDASRATWNKRFPNTTAFTVINSDGYRMGKIRGRRYLAHRIIWAIYYGEWPQYEIDHINGKRDDNRICNLRDVPRSINLRNCKTPKNNTSGIWGVSWNKTNKKWIVRISTNEKRLFVGHYSAIADALVARDKAALAHGYNLRG